MMMSWPNFTQIVGWMLEKYPLLGNGFIAGSRQPIVPPVLTDRGVSRKLTRVLKLIPGSI